MNKRFLLGIKDFHFAEDSVEHINKMPFSGTVAFVDTPSDGSPCGAGGQKVIFEREAVTKAIETFVGMGVNCVWSDDWYGSPAYALTGHNERFKVGVVEAASVEGNEVKVEGLLWKYDFSDVCTMVKNTKDSLGFSVEVIANKVEERDECLYVTDLVFTGVAILYSDCAAFQNTRLVAQRSDVMNEEQIKALIAEAVAAAELKLSEALGSANEKVGALEVEIAGLKASAEEAAAAANAAGEELKAANEALKAENEELRGKVEGLGAEVVELKASKEPQRKSAQFNTLSKYGEGKTVEVLCSEISEDASLSASEKWALKLQAWKKEQV